MIHRAPRTQNFTIIGNEIFDRDLSLEAVGLLCYILSRPDNWRVLPVQLSSKFCGRDRIYRILNELIESGYVERIYFAAGGVEYKVFDRPKQDKKPLPENTEAATDPLPEKPFPEKPFPENTDVLTRTDSKQELIVKDKRKTPHSRGAALPPDWQPSESDRDYGRQMGLSDRQIDDAAEDLRLWAGANANRPIGKKADWGLAFKGWLRRNCKGGIGVVQRPKKMSMIDLAQELRDGPLFATDRH